MNFLIICSYFPPDSAIAAVRPYMLAKNLVSYGHHVTVLRSGEFDKVPDNSYGNYKNGLNVYTFLGEDSAVSQYEQGRDADFSYSPKKKRFGFIPNSQRELIVSVYRIFKNPIKSVKKIQKAKKYFELQKECLDGINGHFDIVFSTYANLENIFAGEYASRKYNAKWIMDFRDPVVQEYNLQDLAWNILTAKIQKYAVETADLCTTVSEGIRQKFLKISPNANIMTLYNGYEDNGKLPDYQDQQKDIFSICYTGQLYQKRKEALEEFLRCIKHLVETEQIKKDKIHFNYAGPDSESTRELFGSFGLSELLRDHGYVTRSEAEKLQSLSDLFLVLSWNTRHEQGVLTGKFYEGIKANKPILSIVVGEVENSELYQINEKHHYGFCYEKVNREKQFPELCSYMKGIYDEKMKTGRITSDSGEALAELFRYDNITKRLIAASMELMGK